MTAESCPVLTTNPAEIEALIGRVEGCQLREGDAQLIGRLLRLMLVLLRTLESKTASLSRLKRLLFGPKSDRRMKADAQERQAGPHAVTGQSAQSEGADAELRPEPSARGSSVEPDVSAESKSRPGHGRLGANAYPGAKTVRCADPTLQPGGRCPHRPCSGHLYDTHAPQIFIRLEGRPAVEATRYEQPVLRCSACQARFAAPLPPGVSPERYDATADAAMALMKYGAGMPLYRLSRLQALMGVPLPVGTQFERCEGVANAVHPIYLELQRQAASGEVLHTDDTGVKILACLKENAQLPADERQGVHTTGIGARVGEREVALYFSGRRLCADNCGVESECGESSRKVCLDRFRCGGFRPFTMRRFRSRMGLRRNSRQTRPNGYRSSSETAAAHKVSGMRCRLVRPARQASN